MAQRDYYEVLGITKTATADEIKRAHRKLALKHHPDRNKGNKDAEERFKEIQEAYDVLSDDTKRANYDQFGHAGVGGAAGGGRNGDPYEAFRRAQAGRGGAGPGRSGWKASPGVTVEDFDFGGMGGGAGGGGDFSEMFEQMFGGGGRGRSRGRSRPQPQRGADLEHPVTLTFEQAARGTDLTLKVDREGKIETIDVKVPPGVKEGSRVRIKGRGQQTGGEPGDLFIVTSVLPHRFFSPGRVGRAARSSREHV
jgi:molecular chaperone DnaJ